jgi:hypothetical protein
MKSKALRVLLCAASSLAPGFAAAGVAPPPPTVIGGSHTETRAYAGLAWALGGKKQAARPDLVVGAQSLKVKTNDRVNNGSDISARFSLVSGLSFDSIRLSVVGGERQALANAGVGYSFGSQSLFGTLAVQGPYSRAGVDYEFASSGWRPYVELLTIGKPKKAAGRLACDSPFILVGDRCAY